MHYGTSSVAAKVGATCPACPRDAHLLVEDQARQVIFRYLPEGLSLLRRVDALEANLVLLAISIQHGYCVAIGFAHYLAGEVSPGRKQKSH